MTLWSQTTWFPMLRKELVETAARRRTYVIRVVYALAFFGAFLLVYHSLTARVRNTLPSSGGLQELAALGQGNEIFKSVLLLQIVGIFLFLPAMICGLLTDEKERGSLPLLLLTDISAPEAILQKYFGGLIPMLTLLLLTLPVGGFAYLLGGLTTEMVLLGSGMLLALAGTVAAIALACSSYARTTIGAFMGTYLILGAFYFLPPDDLYPSLRYLADGDTFWEFIVSNGIVTSLALLLACRFYHTRATVTPKHYLRRFFHYLDARFKKLNERFGGIDVIKDTGSLAKDRPVLWRERQRRHLGKARYQIRYFVAIEGIAIMLAFFDLFAGSGSFGLIAWGIGSVVVIAQASNAVVADRLTQSLEVLLTTPLTGAEIIREKARSLLPLIVVVAFPIWTLSSVGALSQGIDRYYYHSSVDEVWIFALHEALHLILLLSLFVMIGLAVGLGARSRVSAMMKAIGVIVLWCLLPVLVLWGMSVAGLHLDQEWLLTILYTSPSGFMAHHLEHDIHMDNLFAYLLFLSLHALIIRAIYGWCLRNADRKLGRPV